MSLIDSLVRGVKSSYIVAKIEPQNVFLEPTFQYRKAIYSGAVSKLRRVCCFNTLDGVLGTHSKKIIVVHRGFFQCEFDSPYQMNFSCPAQVQFIGSFTINV